LSGGEKNSYAATRPVRPRFEHDACGVGFIVDMKGRKSHGIVRQALQVLINLPIAGACGARRTPVTAPAFLVQVPDKFLRKVAPAPLPPAGEYGVGLVFLPHDAAATAVIKDSSPASSRRKARRCWLARRADRRQPGGTERRRGRTDLRAAVHRAASPSRARTRRSGSSASCT
jgi:hypothetical protein